MLFVNCIRMMAAVTLCATLTNSLYAAKTLVFNTTTPTNDLEGSLAAQVLFAQSQIVPAQIRTGDHQPHLVGNRRCLVMVRPLQADSTASMQLAAVDKGGETLGILDLVQPEEFPKTAYYLDGIPKEPVSFQSRPGVVTLMNKSGDLKKLSDPDATFLNQQLQKSELVEIQTADGRWSAKIYLPEQKNHDGKMIRIHSNATVKSTVHYGDRSVIVSCSQTLQFKAVRGQWLLEDELQNQNILYAAATWSCVLPAEWIVPGLNLWFRQEGQRGRLKTLKIGAPTELLLHTIDLGMLAPPRDQFKFATDSTAHREYFQTVPTSRMIVSEYESLFLRQVMLPDGTLLIEQDPSTGGWHTGTMRQRIGKELISHGINNANYGVHSTAGIGEGSHPYVTAQLTAHTSCGNYSNGIVTHGGSGGGGIVTLDQTIGNEFSHEVGHNYGLGHYEGGFLGSVHHPAGKINSTWGWDADKNRFIPNFSPYRSGKDACLSDQCQSPFYGRSFGLDAMAGGAPLSSFNRFTLYTPYSASKIQSFLESKAVFDSQSPSGFRKWNIDTGHMDPYDHTIEVCEKIDASVNGLTSEKLISLLSEYDVVVVSMQDGKWIKNLELPRASMANRGRTITIEQNASYDSFLLLHGERLKMSRGFKASYLSDGKHWNKKQGSQHQVKRKPQEFGIPVTTLVGYYDPQNKLVSYIYPALHGAYGFTYADDSHQVTEGDCYLRVETREGPLSFRLANHRIDQNVMNKFHINVPETMKPRSVSIMCQGKVADKKTLSPVREKLTYREYGE